MKKIYIAILFFTVAAFSTQAQTTLYQENFDGFTVGEGVADQAGDPWTTWSETPGSSEDPVISDLYSSSPSNSVNILEGNDAVLLLGDKTSGRYKVSFKIYIPGGKVAYFNVLQDFAGTNSEWGTQLYFDNGGEGRIDAGAESSNTFEYNYNEWILIESYIDLDNDWADVFVGGELIASWQWTLGTFGTPGPLQLGAVNFYAWDETGTPDYFVDDILYQTMPLGDAPTDLAAQINVNFVNLTWDAPATGTPLEYYVFRSNELLGTTTALTFQNIIKFPGTYTYYVKAFYEPNGLSSSSNAVDAVVEGGTERSTVLYEVATGTWCFYCPGSAMGVDEMVENGHDVSIIEYHIGDDNQNEFAVDRDAYYGVTGYPSTYVDGVTEFVGGSNTESLYDTYLPAYENRIDVPSIFGIDVDVTYNPSRDYSFSVNVSTEQMWSYEENDVVLQVALTESHIAESWYDLDEVNFVLREMYPSAFGTSIPIGEIGNIQEFSFDIDVPAEYMIENCELVFFIQDNDTREVMNATTENLGQIVGVSEVGELYSRVYPNPATDQVSIESEGVLKNISIFSLNGQKVYEVVLDQKNVILNIDFLETGMYMIRLETEKGSKVEKLNVR